MRQSKPSNRTSPQKRMARNTTRYVVDYIDHAPVWRGPIFAHGVFRPTQNGAAAVPLEVQWTSTFGTKEIQYLLCSQQALNITDQAVYFHLCQLLAAGNAVPLPPTHPRYAVYRTAIAANGFASTEQMAVLCIKPSDLAAGIGLTRTGTNAKSVIESLNRLSQATLQRELVDSTVAVHQGGSQFLAFLVFTGELRIVLHFESTKLAQDRSGVAWINMREQRSLRSKPAKRLHAWLSAWASPTKHKLVGLDKLVTNVWGDTPISPEIRKDRMRTLRAAIKQVGELRGWSCSITEDGRQLLVRKPLFAGTTAQRQDDTQAVPQAQEETSRTKPMIDRQSRAGTPAVAAATSTRSVGTPTEVAQTPTAHSLEAALGLDSEELLFSL